MPASARMNSHRATRRPRGPAAGSRIQRSRWPLRRETGKASSCVEDSNMIGLEACECVEVVRPKPLVCAPTVEQSEPTAYRPPPPSECPPQHLQTPNNPSAQRPTFQRPPERAPGQTSVSKRLRMPSALSDFVTDSRVLPETTANGTLPWLRWICSSTSGTALSWSKRS
jgi:hypothetical protein